MQKVIMIAVQDNSCWIRFDQIQYVDPAYDGDNLIELEVYLLSGENVTIDDPEDIKKVMAFLVVLSSLAEVEEFARLKIRNESLPIYKTASPIDRRAP